jgi:hypothetical protein
LLKRDVERPENTPSVFCSIHPQGWVLVEPPVVGEQPFAPTRVGLRQGCVQAVNAMQVLLRWGCLARVGLWQGCVQGSDAAAVACRLRLHG